MLETSQKKLPDRWQPRKEGLYGKIQIWKRNSVQMVTDSTDYKTQFPLKAMGALLH